LTIKDSTEEVARLLGRYSAEKFTGKISVQFDLREGGIGSARATIEHKLNTAAEFDESRR